MKYKTIITIKHIDVNKSDNGDFWCSLQKYESEVSQSKKIMMEIANDLNRLIRPNNRQQISYEVTLSGNFKEKKLEVGLSLIHSKKTTYDEDIEEIFISSQKRALMLLEILNKVGSSPTENARFEEHPNNDIIEKDGITFVPIGFQKTAYGLAEKVDKSGGIICLADDQEIKIDLKKNSNPITHSDEAECIEGIVTAVIDDERTIYVKYNKKKISFTFEPALRSTLLKAQEAFTLMRFNIFSAYETRRGQKMIVGGHVESCEVLQHTLA